MTPEVDTDPTAADLEAVHADIVAESEPTTAGIRKPDAIDSALTYVSDGYFGTAPETLAGTAAHLVRLLVADHPFVDGNKRTALSAVVLLHELNGYTFDYEDDPIRRTLKRVGTADTGDIDAVMAQCRAYASDKSVSESRRQLRQTARTDGDDRLGAVRQLATLDRTRHATTYERLARA